MKITIEVPDTLDEKAVKEWVKVLVMRHLREIETVKLPSVETIIKPILDLYDTQNGLEVDIIEEDIIK